MPQSLVNKEYNTFVKGLITEAGPLTFPENASIDEDNFELNTKGYRSRRLGLDYEIDFANTTISGTATTTKDKAISCFRWDDVNGNGNLIILVCQVGNEFWFFDASASSVSASPLNSGNSLTLEGDSTFVVEYAIISGNLVLTTNDKFVYQLKYDGSADKVSYIKHGLLVRDIWGVDDGLEITYRPAASAITETHKYNLYNQGWGKRDPDPDNPGDPTYFGTFVDDTDSFNWSAYGGAGFTPSNADSPVDGINPSDNNEYYTAYVLRKQKGSTEAPKGRHIIDVFNRGDSREIAYVGYKQIDYTLTSAYTLLNNYLNDPEGWNKEIDADGNKIYGVHSEYAGDVDLSSESDSVDLVSDRTDGGVKCVATYAGRVFFAGFNSTLVDGDSRSPNLGNYILYSQVVDNDAKVGKCYQEGDPTSWEEFDLIATDGGSIKIPGVSSVVKLIPFGKSLLVIARNGVWEIKGEEGSFSATSNQVEKISDVGCVSADSVVVAESAVMYWAVSGIYAISREEVGFNLIHQSVTDTTIRSLYNDIPTVAKSTCRGVYSGTNKRVAWIYNDQDSYTGTNDKYQYNRQLNFDINLGAFFTYTFATDSNINTFPRVAAIFNSPNFISTTYEEEVIVGSDTVVIGADTVVVGDRAVSGSATKTSYMTVKPNPAGNYTFTIGALSNPEFVDWERDAVTAVDAPAYIETGFEIVNDTQRKKQVQYITCHFERTEDGFDVNLNPTSPSGCLLQTKWDFANHANSGKIGTAFQAYRLTRPYVPSGSGDPFNYGQSVITTKNRVRGRGRALTLRFSTEAGKNCILYGWGVVYAANLSV